jgi:uncharacterized protein YlxW (UPF0749 family)
MIDIVAIVKQKQELAKKLAEQKEKEKLQKEKDTLQTKVDVLEKNIEKLEDKMVAQTTSNASTTTPAPAKSKTLMYVGLIAGGIVITYLILKFSKKE